MIFIRRVFSDREIVRDLGVSLDSPSSVMLTDIFDDVPPELATRVYELRAVISHMTGGVGHFEAACFGKTSARCHAAWHTYHNDGRRSPKQPTSENVVLLVYEAVGKPAPLHSLMRRPHVRDRK